MPAESAFKIKYPTTVTLTATLTTCTITHLTLPYPMTGCIVDTANQFITVKTGFTAAVSAGDEISITFGNVVNPITQQNPGTFTLQSFTDSTFTYKIDQILSGLSPQFECDYPCKTCNLPTSKTQCTSCQTNVPTETKIYLDGTSCVTVCPDGKYADDNKICQPCPTACATCSSSTVCLSCKIASEIPYLLNGWCTNTCPDGQCPMNFKCQICNAADFKSLTMVPSPTTVE